MNKNISKIISVCTATLITIGCINFSVCADSVSDVVLMRDTEEFDFFAERENGIMTAFNADSPNMVITDNLPDGKTKAIDFVLDYTNGVPANGENLSTQFDISGKTIDFSITENRYLAMSIYTEEVKDRNNIRAFFIKSGGEISYVPFGAYISDNLLNQWTYVCIPLSDFHNADSAITDYSAVDVIGVIWLRKGSTLKDISTKDHIYVTDMEVCTLTPPENQRATSVSGKNITLDWESADNASVYNVYRDGEKIAAVSENSYTDSSVAAGASYSYYVTSVSASGAESSAPENQVSVKASIFNTAQIFTENSISVQWTLNDNADFDIVRVYTNGSLIGETVQTEYVDTVTEFMNGEEYEIELAAVSNTGEETEKISVGIFTYHSVGIPQNTVINVRPSGAYTMSWDSAMNAVSYNVYCNGSKLISVTETRYQGNLNSLKTEYTEISIPELYVTAVNSEGEESAAGNTVSALIDISVYDTHTVIYEDDPNTTILYNSQYIASLEKDTENKIFGANSAKITFSGNAGWQTEQFAFYSPKNLSDIKKTAKISFWAKSDYNCSGLTLRLYDNSEGLNNINVPINFSSGEQGHWKYFEIPLSYFANTTTANGSFDWTKVKILTFIGVTSGKEGFSVNIDDLKIVIPKTAQIMSISDDFNLSDKTGDCYVINDKSKTIKIDFSEEISVDSISGIQLVNGKNIIGAKISLSDDLKKITVTPLRELENFEIYSIDLAGIKTSVGGISETSEIKFIADETKPVINMQVNSSDYLPNTTYTATAENPENTDAILFMIRYSSDGTMQDLQAVRGIGIMSVEITTPAMTSDGEYILVYAVEANSEHIRAMTEEIRID